MLPDMTPAVERALEAAQRWARRLGAADVQPLHLLQGLLDEEEGRAAALLRHAGLDPVMARDALGFGALAGPTQGPASPLPLHPSTHGTFRAARRLAEQLCESAIASEALLLALLRRDEAARQVLEGLGFALARLEAAVVPPAGPPIALDEPLDLGPAPRPARPAAVPEATPVAPAPLGSPPTRDMDTARLLDASANRAREALRVVEDYCRFVLDDALLTQELKQLRHDLAAALDTLPPAALLAARETLRDVGTLLTTAREGERRSPAEVAFVNLKRLQEALRSLEEFGKVQSAALGRAVEALRYRSYTLERAVVLGAGARQRLSAARLYLLVSADQCATGFERTVREAIAGGVRVVQLREKGLDDRELLARARQVRLWTREAGALFIVNDRPDLARLAEADGVHLGQDDLPVKEARRVLGPDALVGVSTHDLGQLRQAVLDGASYVGVGPTFPSGTKAFHDLAGLAFVRAASAATTLPAFVIGGINRETIAAAVAAGARRVAVSQAVCAAADPRAAAAELLRALTP
jgi:thiamine-phosphate pyrophosphorylase